MIYKKADSVSEYPLESIQWVEEVKLNIKAFNDFLGIAPDETDHSK